MGKLEQVESHRNCEAAGAERRIRAIMTVCATVLNQPDGAERALNRYIESVARVEAAAAAQGNAGLASVCALLQVALTDMQDEARGLSTNECELLSQWPDILAAYVAAPNDAASCTALAEYLAAPQWKAPLCAFDVEHLAAMLNPEAIGSTSIDAIQKLDVVSDGQAAEPPASALIEGAESAQVISLIEENPATILTTAPSSMESTMEQLFISEEARTAPITSDNELVQLLRDELTTSAESMCTWIATLASPTAEAQQRTLAATDYREQVERLALASEAVGLEGLKQVFAALLANLPQDAGESAAVAEELRSVYDATQPLLLDYLVSIGDLPASLALIEHLQVSDWPRPLDEAQSLALAELLANPVIAIFEDEAQPPRQTDAQASDVSLALPEDLNPELLNGLLQELPVQTGTFTSAMQRIAAGAGNLHDLDEAKRAAHTLKGAANTVGVRGIANLTHHLEDILVALSKEKTMPNRALADMLQTAGDCLEAMSEALVGISEPPSDALHILQEVLNWANRIDRDGVPAMEQTIVSMNDVASIEQHHEQEQHAITDPKQATGAMLRVPANVIDEVLRLAGEMIISNAQLQERLRQTKTQSLLVSKQHQAFMQLTSELENLVDIRGAASRFHKSEGKTDFDPLEFEHYNELHTITRRLIETATDARALGNEVEGSLVTLNDVLEDQRRLQLESQNAVLRTRMAPVSSIFSRLQRGVRQTCRLLEKQVELTLVGADTYVDLNVLNELVDPLMHVLRNAIDHGIEPAELRIMRGKRGAGHIELSFAREGNYVVARCKDDGGGLDLDAIRIAAENKGMISPDGTLTDEEISRLILVPGFSTRGEATQISGRGIGMDIVHSRLMEMKGSINLISRKGNGLIVEMRIPATLISTHGLLVRACGSLLAISCRGIEDVHYVTPEQIKLLGNHATYHVNGQIYDVLQLESMLNLPPDRRQTSRSAGVPALLVKTDLGVVQAVLAQEVIDSRELVFKSLGRYVPKAKGVVGATILGDGSVAPVIDLPELLRHPERAERTVFDREKSLTRSLAIPAKADVRTALVVDDSLSARRAAAEVMRNAGFEVCMAMDGLDAVTVLDRIVPSVILVDMEMPRMNGLEFTARVRAREATKDVPIIMITSRSTEKHRQEAKAAGVNRYITKPFNDDNLLDEVMALCK